MSKERHLRLVDRLVLHEGPIEFSVLSERLLTSRARYLVLDLDRTVHLGRNMGELLGWEIGALHAFGARELAAMEPARRTGRLLFDAKRPRGSLRYLRHGAENWGRPGLEYFFWGKLAAKSDWLSAWTYRRFGPEPVRSVQRIPQETLLRLMADVPEATLRALSERVWERHAPDQVIDREDLARVRARCPDVQILITSASPRIVVEVARERLGADHAEGSESGRVNSGPTKISRLAARFPDALSPDVETVGITDTGYGEDHSWAAHFTRVADVNSDSPFPPFVSAASPLEAVHSAQLSSHLERQRRAAGRADWLDPRRRGPPREFAEVLTARELENRLAGFAEELELLHVDREANAWPIARSMRDARRSLDRSDGRAHRLFDASRFPSRARALAGS